MCIEQNEHVRAHPRDAINCATLRPRRVASEPWDGARKIVQIL